MALVLKGVKKVRDLVTGDNPYENKRAEKEYNSSFYALKNFSYIFEIDKKTEVCSEIFEYIKRYQHLLREYNCSTVTYRGNSYVLPPLNEEITISTELGLVNITALSRNGMDLSAFRIAEPLVALPWRWGTLKLIGYLESRCSESLMITDK